MHRRRATFVRNEVEPGWLVLSESVPIGKQYVVDVDRVEELTMLNTTTGRARKLNCVWVLDPAPPGWLPLLIFKLEADA